jgi:hypothetical protein
MVAYFASTVILVFDINRNKLELCYIYVMKSMEQYSLGGCSVGITDGSNI